MGLAAVTPLTDAEAKQVSEIQQKQSALRQRIADAQTAFAAEQAIYDTAMLKAKEDNEPRLNAARAIKDDAENKYGFEITQLEMELRQIRSVDIVKG